MSNFSFKNLNPSLNDSEAVTLKKILARLQLNASVAVETPSTNVAVTNTPLAVQFPTAQSVSVVNTPSVNANVTNASLAVTSSGEFETISRVHAKNHLGEAFSLSEVQAIGNGSTYLWMISTPMAPTEIHMLIEVLGTVEHSFSMYEAPVSPVGGIALTPVCRNRNTPQPNVVTALSGVTVGGNGNLLLTYRQGNKTQSSGNRGEEEWELAHATNYLFAVTAHAASGNFTLTLRWYLE